MATKTKQWPDGSSATIQYGGQGDGEIIITSDPNSVYEARSMQITVETTDGSGIQRVVTINQAAKQRIDLSAAVVTASNQTYSGSAKTPTPTVTLNGTTIPSTGYDVSYSDNTNAGTATITIAGKGDYTGTAYGTFTINKAAGVAGVSSRSLTYSRSAQNLVTTSGNTGTVHYRLGTSGSWSTSIPTSTNAGTYTIYYYVDASTNYNAVGSSSSPYNVSTTMAKRTPVLSTSPTLVTGLSYTGSAQNLLSGGAMKHSSSNSTSVGGTFTYAQGTNAGTYSSLTWSFTPTDTTNYNSTSGSVSGSVTIAKASRTVSFVNAPTTITDDTTTTLSASVSAGSGDGVISFSSNNANIATVSDSTLTGIDGGTCIITVSVSAGTNYASASSSYTLTVTGLDYVNLGLPSGLKWAKNNVDASSPSDYGNLFSWANVDGHRSGYTWGKGVYEGYHNTPGFALNADITPTGGYDAARVNMGSPWRMPTYSEFGELIDNCTSVWTTMNGVHGRKLTSKINGRHIFLPGGGMGYDTGIFYEDAYGLYWTSTYGSDTGATKCRCVVMNSQVFGTSSYPRFYGGSIRAVKS